MDPNESKLRRLTAYVRDELSEVDVREIEAEIQADPSLRELLGTISPQAFVDDVLEDLPPEFGEASDLALKFQIKSLLGRLGQSTYYTLLWPDQALKSDLLDGKIVETDIVVRGRDPDGQVHELSATVSCTSEGKLRIAFQDADLEAAGLDDYVLHAVGFAEFAYTPYTTVSRTVVWEKLEIRPIVAPSEPRKEITDRATKRLAFGEAPEPPRSQQFLTDGKFPLQVSLDPVAPAALQIRVKTPRLPETEVDYVVAEVEYVNSRGTRSRISHAARLDAWQNVLDSGWFRIRAPADASRGEVQLVVRAMGNDDLHLLGREGWNHYVSSRPLIPELAHLENGTYVCELESIVVREMVQSDATAWVLQWLPKAEGPR